MSGKPTPLPDAETQPFWDAAREGRLTIQRCNGCGSHIFYPRIVCPSCMSDDIAWVDATGRATVHSVTVVHRAPGPFRDEAPYAIALVELEEGPRMMTRILTDDPAGVGIGDRVAVRFEPQGDGPPLPFFAPT